MADTLRKLLQFGVLRAARNLRDALRVPAEAGELEDATDDWHTLNEAIVAMDDFADKSAASHDSEETEESDHG